MLLWCIFMSKPENPHVFPWCGDLNDCPTINLGMTIRDYFAAAALQGMLANHKISNTSEDEDKNYIKIGSEIDTWAASETAYSYADAMLKERLK